MARVAGWSDEAVTMRLRGGLLEMEGAILEATNAVGCCLTEEALKRFDTDPTQASFSAYGRWRPGRCSSRSPSPR